MTKRLALFFLLGCGLAATPVLPAQAGTDPPLADWFLLQPNSIEQLARTLFTGILALYLLSIKDKSRATWWLFVTFTALTMNGTADFMDQSVYASWQVYFGPLQVITGLSAYLALTLFAYEFLENPFPRESKAALFLISTFVLVCTGLMGYPLLVSGTGADLSMSFTLAGFGASTLTLWFLIVLMRKTVRLSEDADPTSRFSKDGAQTRIARLAAIPTRFIKPKGRSALAHRAFALLSIVYALGLLAGLLHVYGLLPGDVGMYLWFTGAIIFFLGFVVVYINHVPEPTTLQVKLIGLALVLVVAVFAIWVHVVDDPGDLARANPHLLVPDRQTIRFDPVEDGGYQVTPAPFLFDPDLGDDLGLATRDTVTAALGFPFPFFDASWREALVDEDAAVFFGPGESPSGYALRAGLPRITPLSLDLDPSQGGGVFYKREPGKATITWHEIPRTGTSELNTIQVVLYERGRIEFTYNGMVVPPAPWTRGIRPHGFETRVARVQLARDLPYTLAAGTELREDDGFSYRRFAHDKTVPLVYLLLGSILFVLVIFPLLFRTSLVIPLETLLDGVRQVNKGDLETQVPVRANDEIGALAHNFNQMTRSLKTAEDELITYAESLERLKNRLQAENTYLQDEIKLVHNFENIITRSEVLKRVLRTVEQVAATDATVLILGESGTGKELIARAIHNISPRSNRPLVKVNCATLPAELIESELFGHEKGAFTGAVAKKVGRFELADGGTIFLDEIGELPLALQGKLLRVLQEGEFERLGNPRPLTVDVRVIAATNRDLEKEKEQGGFREDLYYRLCVFPIESPPLRARKEDIPLLVHHFVRKYGKKIGKPIEAVPQSVIDRLQRYHWPGNVRELENVIERAVILSPGKKLVLGDWLSKAATPSNDAPLCTLEEQERRHILKALALTNGRVSGEKGAAKLLGINPHTLTSRMKKLGINRNA